MLTREDIRANKGMHANMEGKYANMGGNYDIYTFNKI